MAVTFVSKTESSATGSVNDLPIAYPGSGQAGDVLLGIWGSDATQTATLDAAVSSYIALADGAAKAVAFGKKATGSESGSLTMNSAPTANRQAAGFGRWRGSRAINPTNIQSAAEPGTGVTAHASPNITPTETGSGIVLLYVERVSLTALPITPPTGFALRTSFATGGTGGVGIAIADLLTGTTAGVQVVPGNWNGTTGASAVEMYAFELLPNVTGVMVASVTPIGSLAGQRWVFSQVAASVAVTAALTGKRWVRSVMTAASTATAALAGQRWVRSVLAAVSAAVGSLVGKRAVTAALTASSAVVAHLDGTVVTPVPSDGSTIGGADEAVPGAVSRESMNLPGTIS